MQNCPIEKIVTMRGKERLGEIKGIGHMVGPLVRSLRCTCAKLQNTGSLFCISSKKHRKVNYFILSIFVGFKITLRMDYMLHIFVIQMDEWTFYEEPQLSHSFPKEGYKPELKHLPKVSFGTVWRFMIGVESKKKTFHWKASGQGI